MPAPKRQAKKESKPQQATQYVVLRAIDMGTDLTEREPFKGRHNGIVWVPVLNAKADEGPDGQVRVFSASSGDKAIEQYTGKDDSPDLIEGVWKAVPLRSWKAGHQTRRRMMGERLPLEEGW